MFSGIVEEIGTVVRSTTTSAGQELTIACRTVLDGSRIGDSIAVDGVCLTVASFDTGGFTANVQPVTARLSTLGGLRAGAPINLERALAAGQRIGGHYVQGHVDGTGKILSSQGDGASIVIELSIPREMQRYLVQRGFIAVDGASLTIMSRSDSSAAVSLVYHTQQSITLTSKRPGDQVNLEADVIARYVESLISPYGKEAGVSLEMLRKTGFV